MILRQVENLHAALRRKDGSAVTNVGDITLLVYDQDNYSAGAGLIIANVLVGLLQKSFLCDSAAVEQGLLRVVWKAGLLDDDLMQVILQEIGTSVTTMAIIDGEKGALGPRVRILVLGPGHVQNDRHSVFIIIPLNPLVGVR